MSADNFTRERSAWLQKLNSDPTLTPLAKVVAYYLSDFGSVREKGFSFASHNRVANSTGSSSRAVQAAVRQLEVRGYYRVEHNGPHRKVNHYWPSFCDPQSLPKAATVHSATEETSNVNFAAAHKKRVPSSHLKESSKHTRARGEGRARIAGDWQGHPARERLIRKIGPAKFDALLGRCTLDQTEEHPVLLAPSNFVRDLVQRNHWRDLENEFGPHISVRSRTSPIAA